MKAQEFEFNGAAVTFETERGNVMVNATEMAKVFNETVEHFTRLDGTQKFIEACLNNPDVGNLNIEKLEDLIVSKQKSGTYMHRILALKFAAWLNPVFELWIYATIEDLMFGSYKEDDKSLKEIARIQVEIAEKEKTMENSPIQKEIDELRKEEKKEKDKLALRKKMRLSSFRSMFTPEEMNGETKENN